MSIVKSFFRSIGMDSRGNYDTYFSKANEAIKTGKIDKASKFLLLAVESLEQKDELTEEQRKMLGSAYLMLADSYLQANDNKTALDYYVKAHDSAASLSAFSQDAIKMLALRLGSEGKLRKKDEFIFLEYIKLAPRIDENQPVYAFLEAACADKKVRVSTIYYYIALSLIKKDGNAYDFENTPKDDLERANLYLETALKRNVKNKQYLHYLAIIQSYLHQTQKAIQYLVELVALSPKNTEYRFLLAKEYIKIKKYADAKVQLEELVKLKKDIMSLMLLAQMYVIEENYEFAQTSCEEAIALLKEDDFNLISLYINILYKGEKYALIVAAIEKYTVDDELIKAHKNMIFHVGRAYLNVGRYKESATLFEKLLKLKIYELYYYYYGCALANGGQLNAALNVFNELTQKGTKNFIGISYLQGGNIFYKLNNINKAKEYYEKAVTVAPDNMDICRVVVNFYYNINFYKRALELIPEPAEDGQFYLIRGLIYEKTANYAKAAEAYGKAAAYSVVERESRCRLGVALCKNADYDLAFKELKLIYDNGERSKTILYYLGFCAFKISDFETSFSVWTELAESAAGESSLIKNLCVLHHQLGHKSLEGGNYTKAIEHFELYFKDINDETYKQMLFKEIFLRTGMNSIKRGEYAEAVKELKRAFDFRKDAICLFYIGLCNMKIGNHAECLRILESLTGKLPDADKLNYHLALTHFNLGNDDRAIKLLNEILDSVSHESVYIWHAATVVANEHIRHNKYDLAGEVYKNLLVYMGKVSSVQKNIENIVHQISSCLVLTDELGRLRDLIEIQIIKEYEMLVRYYISLGHAIEKRVDEAIVEIKLVLEVDWENIFARRLAFKLYMYKAKESILEDNLSAADEYMRLAREVSLNEEEHQEALAEVKTEKLSVYLKAGKRDEISARWKRMYQQNPLDAMTLHDLAILYFWWAMNAAKLNEEYWQHAIGFWVTIESMDAFWVDWRQIRQKVYAYKIAEKDVRKVRYDLVNRYIKDYLIDNMNTYARKDDKELKGKYEELALTVCFERVSAACYKEVMAFLKGLQIGTDVGVGIDSLMKLIKRGELRKAVKVIDESTEEASMLYYGIPYGVTMLKLINLFTKVKTIIELLSKVEENTSVGKMKLYLSDFGRYMALVECTKSQLYVLTILDAVANEQKGTWEYKIIMAHLFLRKGLTEVTFEPATAHVSWNEAIRFANEALQVIKEPAVTSFINATIKEIEENLAKKD
ncbi:MAG: hypothetical protein L3V56_00520 [Candidatus Magnetoovum sp. WYHC-5]|nr:hypothetical protein [Candidatus Magnetoovum sp. WYHC-5]